jgi:hypothetical protein
MMNNKPSKEIQDKALKVAKGTQKKGQSKEQTKLIAQGIEKGIAEYKKQQNVKSRERDKQRKQQLKAQIAAAPQPCSDLDSTQKPKVINVLPWVLLLISWLGFAFYLY